MKEQENSRELNEIFSKPPGWLTQWGVSYVFIIFIFLLIIANIVKYPDIEISDIAIQESEPPVILYARSTGTIQWESNLENKAQVDKGAIIAYIENSASIKEMKQLKEWSQLYKEKESIDAKTSSILALSKNMTQLGEVQKSYEKLVEYIYEYDNYQQQQPYHHKIKVLEQQINNHKAFKANLIKESKTTEEVFELETQKFRVDSLLTSQQVITEMALNVYKSSYLQKKKVYQNSLSNIGLNEIEVNKVQKEYIEIISDKRSYEVKLSTKLISASNELISMYDAWEKKYCLVAPFPGHVSFFSYILNNYNVKEGDEVLSVIPNIESELIGILKLPMAGSSKVEKGQEVNVKLYSYPYQEYGMMIGKVNSIAEVPNGSHYLVSVVFPNKNITSYGTSLDFEGRKVAQGTGEIITKNRSLFNRIFDKLRFIFQNRL